MVYTAEGIKNNIAADHAKHQEIKDKITQVEGEMLKMDEKMEGNIKRESEHAEILKDMADKLEIEVYQKLMPSRHKIKERSQYLQTSNECKWMGICLKSGMKRN